MSISVTCECGDDSIASEANAGGRAGARLEFTVPDPRRPRTCCYRGNRIGGHQRQGDREPVLGALFFFACLSGVPAILLGRHALRDIDLSKGRLRGRGMAVAGIVLGVFGCLFTLALIMPLYRSAGEAARRASAPTTSSRSARLAQLPRSQRPPAPRRDHRQGRQAAPELASRHPALPGTRRVFTHDSISTSPGTAPTTWPCSTGCRAVYACPSDRTLKPGMTGYQAVIGPDTAFTPDFKPVKSRDFTDGTRHTLLVGESRRRRPLDQARRPPVRHEPSPLRPRQPPRLPQQRLQRPVRRRHRPVPQELDRPERPPRALLTRNGNEVVSPEELLEPFIFGSRTPYQPDAQRAECPWPGVLAGTPGWCGGCRCQTVRRSTVDPRRQSFAHPERIDPPEILRSDVTPVPRPSEPGTARGRP